ncbi:MAG: hypothetical protein IJE09_03590 [Oscillospiraceae bacterium]|nr:hypothetical protein [Oscillospiraceae bacterium]
MRKGWEIVLSIVSIAIGIALLAIIVGFITGAETERIYGVFERLFEVSYNINLDELIHSWIPDVINTIKEAF